MKILLVHNFYGSSAPSGENRIVEEEADLLSGAGHAVSPLFTHSDTVRDKNLLAHAMVGVLTPWNPLAQRKIRQAIARHRPQIVHVHNVFPLLSPAIFVTAGTMGPALVHTLHNYRTLCANALAFRQGHVCTECIQKQSIVPALVHRCYRGSLAATSSVALSIALQRRFKIVERYVDAQIALTAFQRDLLIEGGMPANRIHVRPNALSIRSGAIPWSQRENKAVYIGRMSLEKGARVLIEAWRDWGEKAPMLELIGDGPDFNELRDLAATQPHGKISFWGRLSSQQTQEALASAKLLVLPSICFEGFPLVLREAYAHGVPVLASRIGALPELTQEAGCGAVFAANTASDLLAKAKQMWADKAMLPTLAQRALREFDLKYSGEAGLASLEQIYATAIRRRQRATEGFHA